MDNLRIDHDMSVFKRILRDVLAEQATLRRRIGPTGSAEGAYALNPQQFRSDSIRPRNYAQEHHRPGKPHVSHVLKVGIGSGPALRSDADSPLAVGSSAHLCSHLFAEVSDGTQLQARTKCGEAGLVLWQVLLKKQISDGADVLMFPIGGRVKDAVTPEYAPQGSHLVHEVECCHCVVRVFASVFIWCLHAGLGLSGLKRPSRLSKVYTFGAAIRAKSDSIKALAGIFCDVPPQCGMAVNTPSSPEVSSSNIACSRSHESMKTVSIALVRIALRDAFSLALMYCGAPQHEVSASYNTSPCRRTSQAGAVTALILLST